MTTTTLQARDPDRDLLPTSLSASYAGVARKALTS